MNTTDSNQTAIQNALALAYIIPLTRLIPFNPQSSSRFLSTEYQFLLNAEYQYINSSIVILKQTSVSSIISSFNIFGLTDFVSITYRLANISDYGIPGFLNYSFGISNNSISFNYSLFANGYVCCIIEYKSQVGINITNAEIQSGKNSIGTKANYNICVESNSGEEEVIYVNKSLLQDIGNYSFICTACNDFPIESFCIDENNLISYAFTIENISFQMIKNVLIYMFIINLV